MKDCLIGIDIGSTNIKAAAYSLSGKLLAVASRRTKTYVDGALAEYDAEDLFSGCVDCVRELTDADIHPLTVGIASFGESIIPLDEAGKPLARAISWYDLRAQKLLPHFTERHSHSELYQLTGQYLSAKFTLAKFLWIRQESPGILRNAAHFLFVQDYIAWRLTGNYCTETSLASRSMLFDTAKEDWCDMLLDEAGVRRDQMPQILHSGTVCGTVGKDAAELLGLPSGIPVILAGHDHASASVAAGLAVDDAALDSLGTSETCMLSGKKPEWNEKFVQSGLGFYPYCGERAWRYIASIQASGASIEWFANFCFDRNPFERFFTSVDTVMQKGDSGPLYLPFIRGLQESPGMQGRFVDIHDYHGREAFCYSVLEGISFEYRRRLEDACVCTGEAPSVVRAVGRLSEVPVFMQLKADILNRRIEVPVQKESVSLGAAVLAGRACGALKSWSVQTEAVYEPKLHRINNIDVRYEMYLEQLEQAKKSLF